MAVLGAFLLALACGQEGDESAGRGAAPTTGPPLALEEYFRQLSAAFARLEASAAAEPEPSLPDVGDPIEALISRVQASLDQGAKVTRAFRQEVAALNPPAEAAEAHRAFVQAVSDDLASIEELADKVKGSTSLEEITEILRSSAQTRAASRERCLDLQAIASANGVEVALPCEE